MSLTTTTHSRMVIEYEDIAQWQMFNTGHQLATFTLFFANPVGIPMPWLTGDVPEHFVLLNGQAISRTGWADLFALWGTTYGVGDGSTTFNVPDLRGRILMGAESAGTVARGATAGATTSAHNHDGTGLSVADHSHALSDAGAAKVDTAALALHLDGASTSQWTSDASGTTVGLGGGGSNRSSGAGLTGATDSASTTVSGTTGSTAPSIVPPVFGVDWIVFGGINGGVEP